ncbi:MAG: DUF192 domain-containing protein [Candidatus Aenigmatarchaeota archaeon]
MKKVKIRIGGKTINAEVANTLFEKAKGLMLRKSAKGGMLFIFDEERKHEFWVFGMLIPIDMVFIDKNKNVVDIFRNIKPGLKFYRPREKAMYVLEVKSNSSKRIKIGSRVVFNELR